MTSDTSERGLERLICTALTGLPCDPGAKRLPCTTLTGSACGLRETEEVLE